MPDYETMFELYYPKLYGYFFRRINNKADVEDLVMVTITNFFEVIKKKDLEFPANYLWKIAHNQLVNFYSFNSIHKMPIGFEDIETIDKLIDSGVENNRSPYFTLRLETLLNCMQNYLQQEEYSLVQASIFEGKSSIELATETGLKADNIRQKLHRIFKKTKDKCKKIWG
ncbi:MAG: sigma-70 family RNA polymerase sigma factor [bacterium]